MTDSNHGGARPGAGRPRSNRKAYTVKLDPELVARLDALPGNRSDNVEEACRTYLRLKQREARRM